MIGEDLGIIVEVHYQGRRHVEPLIAALTMAGVSVRTLAKNG
jgi:hypothetical protein